MTGAADRKPFCDSFHDSEQKQEAAYENIVSVTALKTSSLEKGEVYEYTVTFNSQTKEVLNISASIG